MNLNDQLLEAAKKTVSYLKGKAFSSDEDALSLLESVKNCLARLAAGESVCWGPEATLSNFQVLSRLATARLLRLYGAKLSPAVIGEFARFVNSGPHFIQRGSYRFSFDCFSSRIESWTEDLAHFVGASDLRFLEIGSLEGNSASWLLDNILTGTNASLTCVDPFSPVTEARFDENIARTCSSAKLIKLKGPSRNMLPLLDQAAYHFIYVDGSHHQVDVLEDAIFSWRLLRSEGILVLDDYMLRENPINDLLSDEPQRPDQAIDAFLSIYKGRYHIIRFDDQVTLRKL